MSDFRKPLGFEEALRPPIDVRRARITPPVLRPPGRAGDAAAYAQLARIIRRAPAPTGRHLFSLAQGPDRHS